MSRRRAVAALFIAVFGLYLNSLGNKPALFDDSALFSGGVTAGGGPAVFKAWLARGRGDPVRGLKEFFLMRQIRNLSLWTDQFLFSGDLWASHLVNMTLHFLAAFCAFLAATRVLGSPAGGLAAALLFAAHPVQTESVAYLAGRRDVLSGAFVLASLALWTSRAGGRGRTAAALILWLVALGSKPSAIFLPLAWLAHDRLLAPPESREKSGRPLLWVAAACFVFIAAVHLLQEKARVAEMRHPAAFLWHGGSRAAHWATEPRLLVLALRLLVWPRPLSADYSFNAVPASSSFLEPAVLTCLALLAALVVAAWRLRGHEPAAAFGAAWVGLSFAPMLPLLPTFHNREVFAEHWLYLPVFGFALLAGRLFTGARACWPAASSVALAGLVGLCGMRTVWRNAQWREPITLWTQTVRVFPACSRAHALLGLSYWAAGRQAEAEASLRRAVSFGSGDPRPAINLAVLLLETRRLAEAEAILTALKRTPLGRTAHLAHIAYNLGMVQLHRGRVQEAFRSFQWAAQRGGLSAPSHDGSGFCAYLLGQPREAERLLRRALDRDPGYAPALNNLGLLLVEQGRPAEALPLLDAALASDPGNRNARINAGRALSALARFPEAHAGLREALRLDPGFAPGWMHLSAVLRAWGLPARAVEAAKRAVALDGSAASYRELLAGREAMLSRPARGRRRSRASHQ